MKTGMIAAFAGLAVSGVASAAFVGFNVVTTTGVTNSGQNLTRYELFAVFNGATDTVLSASSFQFLAGQSTAGIDGYAGFWHKDNNSSAPGTLSQQYGTWAPQQIGSATTNRPFDSYLVIGSTFGANSTANADPSWNSGGSGSHAGSPSGWNRPDLVNNGSIGWFNSSPPNLQGRVGTNNNSATEVRLGQFILSASDVATRVYQLTVSWNLQGVTTATNSTSTFTLPAPGALALLGLAGVAGRRRRR